MKRTKLEIFEYSDFRLYLKDRLAELKSQDKKYSLRYLAKKLGLSSNSHIKMVIDGKHNISTELACRVAEFFCLGKRETGFFLAMVRYGQAKTTREKKEALEAMRQVSRFVKLHKVELGQFDYYNDPLTLTLREMVALSDFDEDPKWIRGRLPFPATNREIHLAIERLLSLGLLIRNDDGRLEAAHPHIHTGHGFGSVALRGYYGNSFKQAAEALEFPSNVRHAGGMTMAISRATYERITEHFQQFLDAVRMEIDSDENPEEVYQIMMGFFPLTRVEADGT